MAKGRVKLNKKKNKVIKTVLLLFLLAVILIWLLGLLEDYLLEISLGLEASREGTVTSVEKLEAVVLKAETPVSIPIRGQVKLLAKEGQRVAAGAVLAQIESMDGTEIFELKSPAAGVICFHTDGLETVFAPGNLDELDWEKLKRISSEDTSQQFPAEGKLVSAGDTLLKVIDNLEPVWLAVSWPGELSRPEAGKSSKLWIEAAELEGIWERAAGKLAVIRLERGVDTLPALHRRKLQVEVQYQNLQGTIIPAAALVGAAAEQGVYTWNKDTESINFRQVEVLGQAGDELVVRGLDAGVLVAADSAKAKELIK